MQPSERIVAFNTAEGWSRDVTMDIADELADALPSTIRCRSLCRNSWSWLAFRQIRAPVIR
jgi:hypothetical protein